MWNYIHEKSCEGKEEFGKLSREDLFGLGRGPGEGRDGVLGNSPECVNFGAAD